MNRLLWIDGLGGLTVGILVLAAERWLAEWYGLPRAVVLFMGAANLAYGSYSTSLARRAERPIPLITLLSCANIGWLFVCASLAIRHAGTATLLGHIVLIGEGLYVGGLGLLEWRWRQRLRYSSPSCSPPS